MADRQPIPKTMRFEVFKRDSFTCQYCGAKSPEVVLHCDHIKPVAEGGATELLNLVTACNTCNLGKGAIQLDDMSAIERQRRQIEELNERRLQLEMMLQWRDELAKHQVDEVEVVSNALGKRSKYIPSDLGEKKLRRWIKRYGLSEILASMDEVFDRHLTDDSQPTWNFAFNKIPAVASLRAQERVDPHIRKLLYVQAILRNRWKIRDLDCVAPLRKRLDAGYTIEALELAARAIRLDDNWKELDEAAASIMKRAASGSAAPARERTEEDDDPEFDHSDVLIEESYAAWDDPEFHIRMFAQGLCDGARLVMEEMAKWTAGQHGGYIEGVKLHPSWPPVFRGLRAVGLIQPTRRSVDILRTNESGEVETSFYIRTLSPREITDSFGRHGALRLSFWQNPAAFARVDEVH